MSHQKSRPERNQSPRRGDGAKPKGSLPLTISRPELLNDDTREDFSVSVENSRGHDRSGDEAVALQRYKASIKNDSKVA